MFEPNGHLRLQIILELCKKEAPEMIFGGLSSVTIKFGEKLNFREFRITAEVHNVTGIALIGVGEVEKNV